MSELQIFTPHVPASQLKDYRYAKYRGKLVMLHRALAEQALGKPLPPKAVVHHVDGKHAEGSRLVICQDQRYHFLLHIRQRTLVAGGDPNTQRVCWRCGVVRAFDEFAPAALTKNRACRECDRQTARVRRDAERTNEAIYKRARWTPEARAKMSARKLGSRHSEATRAKIAATLLARGAQG